MKEGNLAILLAPNPMQYAGIIMSRLIRADDVGIANRLGNFRVGWLQSNRKCLRANFG